MFKKYDKMMKYFKYFSILVNIQFKKIHFIHHHKKPATMLKIIIIPMTTDKAFTNGLTASSENL